MIPEPTVIREAVGRKAVIYSSREVMTALLRLHCCLCDLQIL
jgi:hypothetical protein